MEAQQLHRGRLIDHVHLIARDIEATKRFYVAALGALGRKIEGEGKGYFWSDELFVSDQAMATTGRRTYIWHFKRRIAPRWIAFTKLHWRPAARSWQTRRACAVSRGYYGAFVLDPDGNNIEAVFHARPKDRPRRSSSASRQLHACLDDTSSPVARAASRRSRPVWSVQIKAGGNRALTILRSPIAVTAISRATRRCCSEPACHLVSIDARKSDVQEHDVGLKALHEFDPGLSVLCLVHLIADITTAFEALRDRQRRLRRSIFGEPVPGAQRLRAGGRPSAEIPRAAGVRQTCCP